MCGVAGILDLGRSMTRDRLQAQALSMTARLIHRGPDADGFWVDEAAGIALAHCRLAIIDLTQTGSQPMVSHDQRLVLSYNGEIYNYPELRHQLERSYPFRGRSDTEVLLAALTVWGTEKTLERCNGMFAFAVWDAHTQQLTIARDRIGEKPLYYGFVGSRFVFASQLNAISDLDGFDERIDLVALTQFFQRSFVPAPRSIFEGIHKLTPGSFLRVTADTRSDQSLMPEAYWRYSDAAISGIETRRSRTGSVDELETLLCDAVRVRMEADVPLGAFLSGGLDSSLMTALMQAHSHDPVRTFTVAFPTGSHDESKHASAIATHLGTDHTEVELDPYEAFEMLPQVAGAYDEPFADPSALPTLLVSRHARESLTVAITGDGGDELFGGYNRYVLGQALWRRLAPVPQRMRSLLGPLIRSVSPAGWSGAINGLGRLSGARPPNNAGDLVHKLADVVDSQTSDQLYARLATTWSDQQGLVLDPPAIENPGADHLEEWGHLVTEPLDRMMLLDGLVTLPDNMLTKVDRASMAVSLEVRVPLLDHRVVEFAWGLPITDKIDQGRGKRVLREVLLRYLPSSLIDRPKMGFDPPLGAWLRGPLRPWAEDLLASNSPSTELLDAGVIRDTWAEHLTGRRNHDYRLWAVLQFLSWDALR